ncbi:uncharacterized protein Z518_02225 [Rhinocladiella mackenziei CBS 650.93]|uniref:Uncharacterized protein n=1 Tax=Rhinocladiella mackenziei CBS 650.93 TaxID=1442369 RepID=A0A0D2FZ77_9EURO|nr:uncharacterized protein Z518_02225 [Rhinocladiella mackenziei CBS 650.93]KIX07572.1 hypothetical protein Z518_02225 [Rhinocladiella mackenziei CBS 650.93]
MQFNLPPLLAGLNLTGLSGLFNFADLSLPPPREVLPGSQSLTATTWQTQLALPGVDFADHWVYLTGNTSCWNQTRCNEFDQAIVKEYEIRQLRSPAASSLLSFVDCDAEPILCHSWLLLPPALMHISAASAPEDTVMHPIPLPLTNTSRYSDKQLISADQQIAFLMSDQVPLQEFRVWDGYMNPFIGTVGKRGGGFYWGYLKHRFGWLPLPQHAFTIFILLIVRLLIRRFQPTNPPPNAFTKDVGGCGLPRSMGPRVHMEI